LISLAGSSFTLLISSNLGLNCFPIHFEVFSELLKLIVGLLALIHLQETLTICDHCVNVGLVIHGDLECTIPLVELDV
jgi:hypothetical protein